ncbi:MAG TPA: nuclease [Actinotalea sp.]
MPNRIRIDVLPIQEAVASASPSAWRDGLVASRRPGSLTVVLLDGEVRDLTTGAAPEVGEPVAIHPVAEIVAVGGAWYAARPLTGQAASS